MIGARLREAAARRRARWEALCVRCGRCCYEKEAHRFAVVTNWHRPCPHLDEKTRLCTVYEKRFAACSGCRKMTLAHALFTRWLPAECGYVAHYRRRGGPLRGLLQPGPRRGERAIRKEGVTDVVGQ